MSTTRESHHPPPVASVAHEHTDQAHQHTDLDTIQTSGDRLIGGDPAPVACQLGAVAPRAAGDPLDSRERSARAYEVLDRFIDRCERGAHSFPPSAIPPAMRVLLEVARLEAGRSTSNVAVLTPEARRRRILELAGELGDALGDEGPASAE